VHLSWKIVEEEIEFTKCLLVLELQLKMAHVFENWQAVGAIDDEYCAFHSFHGKFDVFTHADLHRLLLLIVKQPMQASD